MKKAILVGGIIGAVIYALCWIPCLHQLIVVRQILPWQNRCADTVVFFNIVTLLFPASFRNNSIDIIVFALFEFILLGCLGGYLIFKNRNKQSQ